MFALIVQFKAFAETHDKNGRLQTHFVSSNIYFQGPQSKVKINYYQQARVGILKRLKVQIERPGIRPQMSNLHALSPSCHI